MGAGKTTVGRLVAAALGRPFVDSDAQIETRLMTTARSIAGSVGVEALHTIEAAALTDSLDGRVPSVVAAAASVADLESLPQLVAGEYVVVLEGDAGVFHGRAQTEVHRPAVPLETARRLGARRRPTLTAVADLVIDVTDIPPAAVAEAILTAFTRAVTRTEG